MTDDCLICLLPCRRTFKPPTKCPCAPVLHAACWTSWTAVAGPMCVVCREPRPEPTEPSVNVQARILWVALEPNDDPILPHPGVEAGLITLMGLLFMALWMLVAFPPTTAKLDHL